MKITNASLYLFLLFYSVVAFAAGPTNFSSEADAYLSKLTAQEEFSGAVLIATNGNVVFAKGYGLANRELNVPNTTHTVFRLASVTKQLTAICILMLQEEHKLNVTNLISQYVENCPPAWRKITIHNLLTHTSGIPDFQVFPDNVDFERVPTTVAVTIKRFRDKPLEFKPGTKMDYSSSGYVLLGYIIEKVSGMPYDKFVARNIFEPLGMKHSGYDHPANILPGRASGYQKQRTNIVNCVPFAMDTPYAAGALYSTVGDLLRWDQSLYSTQLVSAAALNLMFTPFKGDYLHDNMRDYCYGWFRYDGGTSIRPGAVGNIQFESGNRIQYWHAGGISGFATDVIRFPKERVYVVVLSNFGWANSPGIAEKLSSMYFNTE